jgi:hypothetical protein
VVRCIVQYVVLLVMFSARGVVLNVTTASVQLRMLRNSVYLPRGQSYQQLTVQLSLLATENVPRDKYKNDHIILRQTTVCKSGVRDEVLTLRIANLLRPWRWGGQMCTHQDSEEGREVEISIQYVFVG